MAAHLVKKADGKLVDIVVTGRLEADNYEQIVPILEKQIKLHGRIRILFNMVNFYGWSGAALWEDIRFGAKHFGNVERLAVVGDQLWEHALAVLYRPFTAAELHYFDRKDLLAAHAWVEESLELPTSRPRELAAASS